MAPAASPPPGDVVGLRGRWTAVVDGRASGPTAAACRGLLRLAEVPYAAAVRLRNAAFDRGCNVQRVDVPVLCVGNLTLGGTGKTPMVAWLAERLAAQGRRPAIISRGYGAKDGPNDEALELAERLPSTPHLQDPDRVAAARRAIAAGADCLVLDDGFQHRRLARDLDIVLLDALAPWGHEHVFPRGLLREPLAGLTRAGIVVLSRSNAVDADAREAVRRRAAALAPQALWAEAVHRPRSLRGHDGATAELAAIAGRRVGAFAAIGNPHGFLRTLAECGCEVAAFRAFADHHRYTQSDLVAVAAEARQRRVDAVVCTAKDSVKLRALAWDGPPLWALKIALEFTAGEAALVDAVAAAVAQARPA